MDTDAIGTAPDSEPARFWEDHYRAPQPARTARVNPLLAEITATLTPGTALDLGCGAGGDALWLASRRWRVTAVDISANAVRRLAANARSLDLGERVSAHRVDLAEEFPTGLFDLVSAQYLHTPFALPRASVLREAAHALHLGGRLMVVDHGSTAPWSWNQDPDIHYPHRTRCSPSWPSIRPDGTSSARTCPGGAGEDPTARPPPSSTTCWSSAGQPNETCGSREDDRDQAAPSGQAPPRRRPSVHRSRREGRAGGVPRLPA